MENKLVGVLVAIFAFIFVAAYVYVFGGNPTSTDPEDWAYFATYLSGTVGVTAVLGTLYAVVRTLGQQQALIDSQKDMLEKQERQLELAQKQLDGEERRRQVELAYNLAVNVIPPIVQDLKRYGEKPLVEVLEYTFIDNIRTEVNVYKAVVDMFLDEGKYEWLAGMENNWDIVIAQILTEKAYDLGVLVSDCLYEARELEGYFRSVIDDQEFRMIECAMLLRKNFPSSSFKKHQIALKIVDGKQSKPVVQFWHDLGEKCYVC